MNIGSSQDQKELFTCILTHCDLNNDDDENSDGEGLLDIIKEKEYEGFDKKYHEGDIGYENLDQDKRNEIKDIVYKFRNKLTLQ